MSRPATATVPEVGASRPPRICSSVVLPEPEAPTIATRSPAAIATFTPSSTLRTSGPWEKLLCTPLALKTVSFMPQGLRRGGARRAPRRVDGRQGAQEERHHAHLEDVATLHVRGQLAHVVDARIQELLSGEVLERAHQRLQVVGHQGAEGSPEERAGEADEDALDGEYQQHVARARPEGAQDRDVGLLFLHD